MSDRSGPLASDDFTLELRLCDDAGMVSDERVQPGSPGTLSNPSLTYLGLLNNLRARNLNPDARTPVDEPFACTGSAHLAGEHIRCTSPAHIGAHGFTRGHGPVWPLFARRREVAQNLCAALSGYKAQYGAVPIGQQHKLPKGASDRVEAVVRAAEAALAELELVDRLEVSIHAG